MTVYVSIGTDEKVKVCREYGAHLSINYKQKNFAEEVLNFTGNKGMIISRNLWGKCLLDRLNQVESKTHC